MTPERWQQIKQVLDTVLDKSPEERQSRLVEVCAHDASLRREVEAYLAAYGSGDSLIDQPLVNLAFKTGAEWQPDGEPGASLAGQHIGNYLVEGEVARGGMGTIYSAWRADDQFQKHVAIKIINRGMDTSFTLGRFRAERQILAQLDHPYIARLYDGGVTTDGLPYLVMEYVEGVPIDRYCDGNSLSITERLKLFRGVCDAVSYAHRNLIVHRDIKPGNILVTHDGMPKLLDFGSMQG